MTTKQQNFKRIAESRTNKIIDMIDLLGISQIRLFMNTPTTKLRKFLTPFKKS
jgi:hypothetical protein